MRNRIKEYRKKLNLSQIDLGQVLDVSDATVSSWENGRTEPNMEQVLKMAHFFGCSIEALFGAVEPDYIINEENELILIESFRKADAQTKEMAKRLLAYSHIEKEK